jgi:uracil-DNA glycosylase family 4
MGLLFAESGSGEFQASSETRLLNQLGCKACPLNSTPGKIDATGSKNPSVLILGEAAGRTEEEERKQFVGDAGQLLRSFIPKKHLPVIRWNNIINCHPPRNRDPTKQEQECCRPRVVPDIERTRPKAIFGFGNIPLQWVSGFSGITYWRGRRMPVRIGGHTCWYYPFLHPSFLLRIARDNGEEFGSEDERITVFDLERAFAEVEHLPEPVVHTPEMARANVECLTDVRAIESALQWAARQKHVGVDYETNCLRPYEGGAKLLTGSVGTLERAFAFPFDHPGCDFTQSQKKQVFELWKRFLLNAPCAKVVHNLAFEQEWSGYFFGEETLRARPWDDTATAAAIVDERKGKTKPGCFSLEFLVQQYFGFNVKKVSSVDRKRLASLPLHDVLSYNGIDAKYHDGLWDKLWEAIQGEELEYPYELALRRVPTVVLSQLKGVPADQARVKALAKKYTGKIEAITKQIAGLDVIRQFERIKGRVFNPQSNPDVLYVFDDMLKRPEVYIVDKYTHNEKLSADETVLTKIKHPLARALMDLREASGTKSKYIDALRIGDEDCVIYPDGMIHANFNTYFAETGRLSCVRKGTAIQVPSGAKCIEEVQVGDLVYCFDQDCQLVLRRVTNTWFRGYKQVLRLHWIGKGGKHTGYLDVTADHRIRLLGGTYVVAGALNGGVVVTKGNKRHQGRYHRGEHVMALHRGCKEGRNHLYATGQPGLKEARFVFEQVYGWHPEHVHHDDENRSNDLPSNLIGMTHAEHTSLHTKKIATSEEMARRAAKRSPEAVKRAQAAAAKALRAKAKVRFTKSQIEAALIEGKGIRGACLILGVGYGTIRGRIDRWNIPLDVWDGRSQRKERPEQRKKRHPYKGHTEYVGQSKYNHMIQWVEPLQGLYPVYDLEVEGTHNFIANEICVHNCEMPNLQNFPKRDAETKEVRKSIRAPKGCVMLAFDYGQIEARVIAMFTKDKQFCKALWERFDVHQYWAERIAHDYPARIGGKKNLQDKKVMKDFRTDIKNQWTFPLFFGAKDTSVAGFLDIPVHIIRRHVREFWKMFEGVKKWQEQQMEFYKEYGYTECLTGRRRHGPMSANQIYNSPVQGTAAEIVLDAMCRLSEKRDPELQPEINIHDDLTFVRVPEERVDVIAEQVISMMLAVPFSWVNVPITAEMSVGENWMELEEVGTFSSDEWGK